MLEGTRQPHPGQVEQQHPRAVGATEHDAVQHPDHDEPDRDQDRGPQSGKPGQTHQSCGGTDSVPGV